MTVVTRFAPSPTGYLHIGSAFSALVAAAAADRTGGRFLVRIEDTDRGRCRDEFEAQTLDDLAWLGLTWERTVRRQSEHKDEYADVLTRLREQGLLYPCFCTRKEIAAEIDDAGLAPHGPDGPVYPGTCRGLSAAERQERIAKGEAFAERLDMTRALDRTGPLKWRDESAGVVDARPERFGDVVLARKDTWPAYHLAVVWDDHIQGVTLVTRGGDLFDATDVHRLLQALLDLDVPAYRHHRLLLGPDGKRLAKRDKSVTLKDLRAAGKTPDDIRTMIGWGTDA